MDIKQPLKTPLRPKPHEKMTVVEPADVSSIYVLPEEEINYFLENGSSDLSLRHVSSKPEHSETITRNISRLQIRNDNTDQQR
jgi:hypothetical protein